MNKFIFSKENIADKKITFLVEPDADKGVNRIARRVIDDIEMVFSQRVEEVSDLSESGDCPIIAGYVDNCAALARLEKEGIISLDEIRGKREVYMFSVIKMNSVCDDLSGKTAIVIAGSDKRGAIYGLFRLSELLGVSPFVDWLDLPPKKEEKIEINEKVNITSKEPSVRFRGFFINDEWPAFGNWCNHNYGGFNAKAYEHIFELLLRLKGNYMWPAMWSSIFPDDGPGLASAELADEMGVVMGMSHHEPCLRQGEEYKYLRGPESIYGDAWDFNKNREGITRFWEDGLKRGGHLENVITVGMRGEFDSAIMGKDATLKDNIDLLRNVLKTQNKLIKKYVNEDLDKVPRMLALYKEVEPYFYGDSKTKGLMDDKELEGVTLMLCDDNFGNLRTLPTEHMRKHKGGYGMYYHFDYHGLPTSFEWVNSSYLPKVWEQMTTAYEFGIRDLWIVNVGDIFTTEFPLSYFLAMAYDFDTWGTTNLNSAKEYTKKFIEDNFSDRADKVAKAQMYDVLFGYTQIAHCRRPEAMNVDIYDPLNYRETAKLLDRIDSLNTIADRLPEKVDASVRFAVYELFMYPAMANFNVQKMWLYKGLNNTYARQQRTSAMTYGSYVDECLIKDKDIVDHLHKIHDGKWYGMGLSEHIGFKHWCEEECQYPVLSYFEPGNKKRLIVSVSGTHQYTEGGFWTNKKLMVGDFYDPDCDKTSIEISTAGKEEAKFTIECDSECIKLSSCDGVCEFGTDTVIEITVDRTQVLKDGFCATITVKGENSDITTIVVPIPRVDTKNYPAGTFIWCGLNEDFGCEYHPYRYIMMNAEDFCEKNDTAAGSFTVIEDAGRVTSVIKVMPPMLEKVGKRTAPSVGYNFELPDKDTYVARFFFSPTNPAFNDQTLYYGASFNKAVLNEYNQVESGYRVGDGSVSWSKGVLDNIRYTEVEFAGKKGLNTLKFAALSPQTVLERIMIFKKGEEPAYSYLGPDATYRVKA